LLQQILKQASTYSAIYLHDWNYTGQKRHFKIFIFCRSELAATNVEASINLQVIYSRD